jgi:hypothetical protein
VIRFWRRALPTRRTDRRAISESPKGVVSRLILTTEVRATMPTGSRWSPWSEHRRQASTACATRPSPHHHRATGDRGNVAAGHRRRAKPTRQSNTGRTRTVAGAGLSGLESAGGVKCLVPSRHVWPIRAVDFAHGSGRFAATASRAQSPGPSIRRFPRVRGHGMLMAFGSCEDIDGCEAAGSGRIEMEISRRETMQL